MKGEIRTNLDDQGWSILDLDNARTGSRSVAILRNSCFTVYRTFNGLPGGISSNGICRKSVKRRRKKRAGEEGGGGEGSLCRGRNQTLSAKLPNESVGRSFFFLRRLSGASCTLILLERGRRKNLC